MKTIQHIIHGIETLQVTGDVQAMVYGLHSDSRQVSKGSLFIALKGITSDGHAFVPTRRRWRCL
jgi:UDP-N-acetylmuramoyl-L-alanyl-D-glutamate--2,6-diaminopimelate ligase